MATPSPVSPPDNELIPAVVAIKASNPELGIAKTLSAVLAAHPDWAVSEKRLRKVLQNEGLIVGGNTKATEGGRIYPSSRIIEDLDVSAWSSKVQVRYFNKIRGKGLVAKEKISAGEVIWKENPFILAPEWLVNGLFSFFADSVLAANSVGAYILTSPLKSMIFCNHLLSRLSLVGASTTFNGNPLPVPTAAPFGMKPEQSCRVLPRAHNARRTFAIDSVSNAPRQHTHSSVSIKTRA
jgi:hypothetical protein